MNERVLVRDADSGLILSLDEPNKLGKAILDVQ